MSGFDSQFTEEPPKVLQCYCPICLLILREPYQVTCCGKSFCKVCIKKIQARSQPCPTCKRENFSCFQNKGLQQPLYELKVFCSNKEEGCSWQGELGQLDKHLNVNFKESEMFTGCTFIKVECSFCKKVYARDLLESHQTSKCLKRPFTCKMCNDCTYTYEYVTTIHASECRCRPAECPNSCGASNLQHWRINEHVFSQCPLTLVECEFSDAGCDAKVYRRDLPSHLSDNMVTHMSLLATENKRLKEQNDKYRQESISLKKTIAAEKELTRSLFRVPPQTFRCQRYEDLKPFYSHAGGYKLQLQVKINKEGLLVIKYRLLESEFEVQLPCKIQITTIILDQEGGGHIVIRYLLDSDQPTGGMETHYQAKHYKTGEFMIKVARADII